MASNQSGRQRSGRWPVYRQLVRWAARRAVREDVRRAVLERRRRVWTVLKIRWFRRIKEWYPRLHQAAYFIPPIHFYRTPLSVADVAGQLVQVRDNPPPQPCGRQQPINPPLPPPPLSPQVAESLYAEKPPNLRPLHVQDSDHRDDEAQQRCLRSLSEIPNEAMMVLSQLTFRKYLDRLANPLQAAIAQLPIARSLPPHLQNLGDGESDILIIHRTHGVIVAKIKPVGGGQHFSGQSSKEQNKSIVRRVEKAVNQLIKQCAVLRHLVSDLPNIRITLTLLLPNITRAQLSAALTTSPVLTQRLCQTSVSDVAQAVHSCLCQDILDQPAQWWAVLHGHGPDPCMTLDLYERLVARFCGPATTVDVPTACAPRVVVRTMGDAVAETGLQLAVLNIRPKHLYLQGPPGTGSGKTLLLFFAALESAKQGWKVVIMHMPGNVAVTTLLYHQLASILGGPTAARLIHLHPCALDDDDLDVNADMATLQQQVGQVDDVHIIVDEVPFGGRQVLRWVTAVGNTWTQALLWMTTTTLRVSLRCPPTVTAHMAESGGYVINDRDIPRYVTPAVPQIDAGPGVRQLLHTPGVDGHTEDDGAYLWCKGCANNVAAVIRELGVGQPGHRLQYRDVFILTDDDGPDSLHDDDVFVQQLRQQQPPLPVLVVEVSFSGGVMTPLSADDGRQLAMGVKNKIVITHMRAVQGLERSVVFVLGGGEFGHANNFFATSRSTAFLCTITDN